MRPWTSRRLARSARGRAALAAALAVAFGLVYLFVIEPARDRAAPAGAAACGRDYDCYEKHLFTALHERGGEASLAELARLSQDSSYVRSQCHPLSHAIGREAFDFYGSVSAASPHGDGTCWSGFFHGVMERFMFGLDDRALLAKMDAICEQTPGHDYSFDYYNCLHGIGHGVAWREDNDVFRALPYCDALSGGWEQSSCYSGVFMQNIVVDGRMHKSVNLKQDDPVYPCNAVAERYKGACYLGQTTYILRTLDYDYARAFRICDGVETGFVSTCYRSLGRDIAANSHQEAEPVIELCSLGTPSLQGLCYAGAAKNAVYNDHGVANADRLCALVPVRHRAECVAARDEAARNL
jgi:hypothetical protein